jgi:hypothetical protein
MVSPFFQSNNEDYMQHLYIFKDYRPEDGWELIKQEMGAPFDAQSDEFISMIDHPLFILYNKYTGVLRVFVAILKKDGGYTTSSVTLRHLDPGSPLTSVLDLSAATKEVPLRPVDEFSGVPEMSAILKYRNTDRHWMYADFVMSYDPCICSYESRLIVVVDLVQEAKISLSGSTAGEIVTIDNQEQKVETERSTFSLDLKNAPTVAKKAVQAYHTWNDFKNSMEKNIDAHFQYGPYLSQELKDKIEYQKEQRPAALNLLETVISKSRFLRGALSAVPFVGPAMELLSLFTGGGKDPEVPQKVEVAPLSINTTSNYTGVITTKTFHRSSTFLTPGSYIPDLTTVADQYPYYNEPMGLFSMISRPEAEIYQVEVPMQYSYPNWPYEARDTTIIKLKSIPDYVVNFAAGFDRDEVEILGSLIVEYNQALVDGDATVVTKDESVEIISDRMLRTKYVPLGCLPNLPIWFWRTFTPVERGFRLVPALTNLTPKVWLKLLVRLARTDRTDNTQNVLYVGKYNVDHNIIGAQADSYWESPYHGIDRDLVVGPYQSMQNFSTSSRVWSKISVGANVTIEPASPSSSVELVAGEEIVVSPGQAEDVLIQPNSVLRINIPGLCSTNAQPVSLSRLEQFCSSSIYRANRLFGKADESAGSDDVYTGEPMMSIRPIPARDRITVSWIPTSNADVSISIYDPLGNVVLSYTTPVRLSGRTVEFPVDVHALPTGTYMLVLTSGGEVHSSKVLISR